MNEQLQLSIAADSVVGNSAADTAIACVAIVTGIAEAAESAGINVAEFADSVVGDSVTDTAITRAAIVTRVAEVTAVSAGLRNRPC